LKILGNRRIKDKYGTQQRVLAIAGCGFAKVSTFGYPVLPRPQSALATQRLIHADVSTNYKRQSTMIESKLTTTIITIVICGFFLIPDSTACSMFKITMQGKTMVGRRRLSSSS